VKLFVNWKKPSIASVTATRFGLGPEGQEKAKYRFSYGGDVVVMVEGHLVRSYEELVQFASQDDQKDKEFLEVELLPIAVVGG